MAPFGAIPMLFTNVSAVALNPLSLSLPPPLPSSRPGPFLLQCESPEESPCHSFSLCPSLLHYVLRDLSRTGIWLCPSPALKTHNVCFSSAFEIKSDLLSAIHEVSRDPEHA